MIYWQSLYSEFSGEKQKNWLPSQHAGVEYVVSILNDIYVKKSESKYRNSILMLRKSAQWPAAIDSYLSAKVGRN
jgi:hypothetical protein